MQLQHGCDAASPCFVLLLQYDEEDLAFLAKKKEVSQGGRVGWL
jgi:hypothetical protein